MLIYNTTSVHSMLRSHYRDHSNASDRFQTQLIATFVLPSSYWYVMHRCDESL